MHRRFNPKRSIILPFLASLLFLLAPIAPAHAFIPSSSDSFELSVQKADYVILGVIESVETIASPSPRFPSPVPWKRITVRISQVLLGPPTTRLTYLVPDIDWYPTARKPDPNEELLFLLVEGKRYAIATSFRAADPIFADVQLTPEVPEEPRVPISPFSLNSSELANIPNNHLHPFANRDEVLSAAEKYCAKPTKPAPTLPVCTLWPKPRNTWPTLIVVPLDDEMKKLEQQWSSSANGDLRWNASLLANTTKDPANITVLQRLARRPMINEVDETTRAVALSTLVTWGQPVDWDRPHEGATSPQPTSQAAFASLLLLLVAPAYYLRKTRKYAQPLWKSMVTAWLFIMSAIGVAWIRSYGPMDGMEKGSLNAGIVHGNLFLISATRFDAPNRTPLKCLPPLTMANVQEALDRHWQIDFTDWGWGFINAWGHNSRGQQIEPGWDYIFICRIPLWLCALAASTPYWLLIATRALRYFRIRNARGFELLPNART